MELRDLITLIFRLYGRRARVFLSGFRHRIEFLSLALADLQDVVRKDPEDKARVGGALARVLARIFLIAEHFQYLSQFGGIKGLPLVEALAEKYPKDRCSYCQAFPCDCGEKRQASSTHHPDETQLHWRLREWCGHLEGLYGAKNRERGVDNVLNRLVKEVHEILTLALKARNGTFRESLVRLEAEFAYELADAIAWTIATANVLGVNLETAFIERYKDGCCRCKELQCVCTYFNEDPEQWEG